MDKKTYYWEMLKKNYMIHKHGRYINCTYQTVDKKHSERNAIKKIYYKSDLVG